MLESDRTQDLKDMLKERIPNVHFTKINDRETGGIPDLYVSIPTIGPAWIEVKRVEFKKGIILRPKRKDFDRLQNETAKIYSRACPVAYAVFSEEKKPLCRMLVFTPQQISDLMDKNVEAAPGWTLDQDVTLLVRLITKWELAASDFNWIVKEE